MAKNHNNKIGIIALAIFSIAFSLVAHAEVINPPVVFDGIGNENLRSCPSFDCNVVQYGGWLPRIEIIESSGEWYKVRLIERSSEYANRNNQTSPYVEVVLPESQWKTSIGWMYYTLIPESIRPQTAGAILDVKDEVIGTGVLKIQSIVRGCPSTNSCIVLTYLDAGTVLQVVGIDQTGEWYKIKLDDSILEGWDKWISASNFTDESRRAIGGGTGKVGEPTATSTQEKEFLPPAFGNWIKNIGSRFGSSFTQGFLVALALLIIFGGFYLIGKYRLISKIDFSWLRHRRTVGIASSLIVVIVVFFTVSNYFQKREDELKSFIATQQRTIEATQKSVEGLSKKAAEESQQRIAQERAAKEIVQRLETKIASASTNKTTDLASVVSQWSNIIAKIECDVVYNRQSFVSLGSGTALNMNGQIAILSNRHVLVPEDITPTGCRTKVPGSVSTYSGDDIRVAVSGEDWAVFYPNNADSQIRNITATQPAMCTRKPSVGDSVVILGYPSIGSRTSVTATEGIIAGYDGNYFITSAKVEQGNSGGAAILVKDNCLLGIPTFAQVGKVESLARILDISTIFK